MIDSEITGQVADEIEAILQANFSGYTIYGKDDTLASALKNIYRMPGIVITVNPLQPSTAFLDNPDTITVVVSLLFLYKIATEPETIKGDVVKARRLLETYQSAIDGVEQLNYASPAVRGPDNYTVPDGSDLVYFTLTAQKEFVEG